MNPQLLPLSEPVLHVVGSCLLHFVWQGVLVAAGLACMMAFLRKSAASTRYAILFAGLLLMAALPVITMVMLLPPSAVVARDASAATPPAPAVGSAAVSAAPALLSSPAVAVPPASAPKLRLPDVAYWRARVRFSLGAAADEAGHFKVDHVPALPLRVGESRRWVTSHAVDVTPEPGRTLQVDFCTNRNGAVRGKLIVDPGFASLGAETEEVWNSSRRLFITARRHGDDTKDENTGFVPIVLEDGTFTLDCLPPGDYDLTATLHDAPPKNACGRGTAAARAERAFTIAQDQSSPLALGDLAFAAIPRPEAGSVARELQGTTLDGKAWKLSDEKGTPVLLVFWATWCAPCKAEIPVLKALWKQYGESGKLKIVGLNLDREMKEAVKFVAREELPWPQHNVGAWSEDNPVTMAYGISYIPSNWLVDASGNVVESKIPADALASVLERHLQ